MLDEEYSEFGEESDQEKEHDLDFGTTNNFVKIQDAKAAQRQELAINLLGNEVVKEKWSMGIMEFLEKRALLDLPIDRPLAGLVLDVQPLVSTHRKKLILKKAVLHIRENEKRGGLDCIEDIPATKEEVTIFWDLILDIIMEAVEGPMRTELL